MQSERKIYADINSAGDTYITVTLSGEGVHDLTEPQIEAALSTDVEPVAWRSRHSAQENWYYSDGARSWWECQPLYAAPTVAEPVKTAPDVAVKALEWLEGKGGLEGQFVWSSGDPWVFWIVKNPDSPDYVWCENMGIEGWNPCSPVRGSFPTLEKAKAAAQADYEARILSALSAQVQNVAAYLYTSKSTGGSLVGFKPLEQTSLRHDEWICEPLYRGGMKETVNAS